MFDTDRKLTHLLMSLLPTLKWLITSEPVASDSVPSEHAAAIKQLDGLGLVYKRNARTYGLQKERLKRLIGRIASGTEQLSLCLMDELFDRQASNGQCPDQPLCESLSQNSQRA